MASVVSTLSPGLAKDYDKNKSYHKGNFILHHNAYWKCRGEIGPEAWNEAHWEEIEEPMQAKADLENGKVPYEQLPEMLNDVLEYDTLDDFPDDGTSGKIYVAKDTGKIYRRDDDTSEYVEISKEPTPVAPSTETSAKGKPADAKDTGDALAGKQDELSNAQIAAIDSVVDERKTVVTYANGTTATFYIEGGLNGGVISGENAVTVKIGTAVTGIGMSAFNNWDSLTSVTIPNSVTSIGGFAFYGCSGLTSVTIPDSVTIIEGSAFSGCSGLTSVVIGNGVTSIGARAFWGCSGLTSVTIPDSVTSIGQNAFEYCSGLTSVTIPDSVTSIGFGAFGACNILTNVTFRGKSFAEVQEMANFNWGILDISSIKTWNDASEEWAREQIDTYSPLVSRSFTVPASGSDGAGAASAIYFRPRFFGMLSGDRLKSVVVKKNNNSEAEEVYAKLFAGYGSSGTELAKSSNFTIPYSADEYATIDFSMSVQLPDKDSYYTIVLYKARNGIVYSARIRFYVSDTDSPDCFFGVSMKFVPAITARFYSYTSDLLALSDIDSTLSKQGKPADAKATGDVLAGKLSTSGGTITGDVALKDGTSCRNVFRIGTGGDLYLETYTSGNTLVRTVQFPVNGGRIVVHSEIEGKANVADLNYRIAVARADSHGNYRLADRTMNKLSVSRSTSSNVIVYLPNSTPSGYARDFYLDIKNSGSASQTIRFVEYGSTGWWTSYTPNYSSITDVCSISAGTKARIHFSETSFTDSDGLVIFRVDREDVVNGSGPTPPPTPTGDYILNSDGTVSTVGSVNQDGTLSVEGSVNSDGTFTVDAT